MLGQDLWEHVQMPPHVPVIGPSLGQSHCSQLCYATGITLGDSVRFVLVLPPLPETSANRSVAY